MSISEIRQALFLVRSEWSYSDHIGHGFYAIFLKDGVALPEIETPEDGMLYIGKTEAGFQHRNHLAPKNGHSGHCTLRRSLGAVLKKELSLSAEPKSGLYNRRATFLNYRFTGSGEVRLTRWMKANLLISRIPFENNVCAAEHLLIQAFRPPLNLKYVHTDTAKRVRILRRICAEEAKSYARKKLAA